jgi:hypothetical protein
MEAAKSLGLTFPITLLGRADEDALPPMHVVCCSA